MNLFSFLLVTIAQFFSSPPSIIVCWPFCRRWCMDLITCRRISTIPQNILPWTRTPTRLCRHLMSSLIATTRPNWARDYTTITDERGHFQKGQQIAAKAGVKIRWALSSVKARVNDDLPTTQLQMAEVWTKGIRVAVKYQTISVFRKSAWLTSQEKVGAFFLNKFRLLKY